MPVLLSGVTDNLAFTRVRSHLFDFFNRYFSARQTVRSRPRLRGVQGIGSEPLATGILFRGIALLSLLGEKLSLGRGIPLTIITTDDIG